MTARAKVVGIVDGEILRTGSEGRPIVSFVLADNQRALSDDGLIVQAHVAWCQVVCAQPRLAMKAGLLVAGDLVTVSGLLEIIRASPLGLSSDAVLISVIADNLTTARSPSRLVGDR